MTDPLPAAGPAIPFTCPTCRTGFRVPPRHAGRRAKCPVCRTRLTVPGDMAGEDRTVPEAYGTAGPASTARGPTATPGGTGTVPQAAPGPTPDRETIAGYAVEGELGRGGMGVVLLARQPGLNRPVALKLVLGNGRADPLTLGRFLAEAEAAAAVRHPNVVQVYQYGEDAGRPFLALEYLPGGSLSDRLKRDGRLDPRAAAGVMAAVAAGVAAAHSLGIVHRDLKPGNVLFDADGAPKVADFGLAKRGPGAELTHTGAVMGTPAYMSPEQAGGRAKFVGPQSDVWALGVMLYELLAGGRPFRADTTWDLIAKVMNDRPESLRAAVPGVPRDLEMIVGKCLEKSPADRYPSAAELAADLDRFVRGEPVSVRPARAVERAVKWARRKPTAAAACGLGLLAVLLGGGGAAAGWQWLEAEAARAQTAGALAAADEERARAEGEAARARTAADREQAARAEEEAARRRAERARADAEAAAGREADARRQADAERARAEAARDRERVAADALARTEYARTVGLAHGQAVGGRPAVADALLDGCRADLRGWEWDYVRRLARPETLRLVGHDGPVYEVTFRPDGGELASAGRDGTVRLWDPITGAARWVLRAGDGLIYGLAYSPDGRRLAVGGADGRVRVWDVAERAVVHALGDGQSEVAGVAFSPDGRRLAAGFADGRAVVWDADAGRRVATLDAHGGQVSAVAFSPDGRLLATGSFDHTVKVWRADGWAAAHTLRGHTQAVVGLAFAPIAAEKGEPVRLASGGDDGTVRLWDAVSGTPIAAAVPSAPMPAGTPAAVELPVPAAIAAPARAVPDFAPWLPPPATPRIGTLDGDANTVPLSPPSATFGATPPAGAVPLAGLAFAPGGWLAAGRQDGTAVLLRVGSRPVPIWETRTAVEWRGGQFVPWTRVASRSAAVTVTGFGGETAVRGHAGRVNAVAVAADRLATAGDDGTVRVWTRSPAVPVPHVADPGFAAGVGFTADGRLAAVSPDGGRAVMAAAPTEAVMLPTPQSLPMPVSPMPAMPAPEVPKGDARPIEMPRRKDTRRPDARRDRLAMQLQPAPLSPVSSQPTPAPPAPPAQITSPPARPAGPPRPPRPPRPPAPRRRPSTSPAGPDCRSPSPSATPAGAWPSPAGARCTSTGTTPRPGPARRSPRRPAHS